MFRIATDAEAIRSLGGTTAEFRADGATCHTWSCHELGTIYVTDDGDLVYYCDEDKRRVEALRERRNSVHAGVDDGSGDPLCGAPAERDGHRIVRTTLDDYESLTCNACRATLGLELR